MARANRVLPREHTGHSKPPIPTIQEKTLHMGITRWSTPKSNWLYSFQPKMEELYTVSKTRPGLDCGSDHELLIVKFRLKLKKVGKTTRPFRYDLNQIPYTLYSGSDKRIQWTRFDRQSAWWTMDRGHDIVQETGIRPSPRKRNAKKQNGCLRRAYK